MTGLEVKNWMVEQTGKGGRLHREGPVHAKSMYVCVSSVYVCMCMYNL